MKKTIGSFAVAAALGGLLLGQAPVAHAQVVVADTDRSSSLVTTGVVTLGLSYGAAALVAATSTHQGDNRLYVPVLGPWLDLADRGSCPVESSSCDHETTNKILLVSDGVIQAVGALTILSGLMSPSRPLAQVGGLKIATVAPVSYGAGRPGLAAVGTF
jgi:hypothetical protein